MDSRGSGDIAYNEAVDLTGEAWTLRGNVADGSVANLGRQVCSILAVLGTSDTPTDAMLPLSPSGSPLRASATRTPGWSATET